VAGATLCAACPNNAVAINSNTACQCNAGYVPTAGTSFADGNLTCTGCTGNTYSMAGATLCAACPNNAVAINSNTACQCNAGYVPTAGTSSADGNLTCTGCTGNTYSMAGATLCAACPNNAVAINSNTACQCNAGYVPTAGTSSADGNLTCTQCGVNTFSVAGAASCSPCTSNSFASVGSSTCTCNDGCTTSGSEATLTCSPCDYFPNAATNVAVGATNVSSVTITWTDSSAAAGQPKASTRFVVRCVASTAVCSDTPALESSDVLPGVQSGVVFGLSAGPGYKCFVRSFNAAGDITCSSGVVV
jgi:hypothetical protein